MLPAYSCMFSNDWDVTITNLKTICLETKRPAWFLIITITNTATTAAEAE